ncbi:dephospho-CoA kinase [Bacillus marinisedimentorum]|uniref:dephospho-CoA kinase n=1 Tax=Bacillus marinisedimentorum TaxID=1821260 RepID=UPI000872731A|nr:dephospho-CoA kinase [Bacillus marinisedimentorum]
MAVVIGLTGGIASGKSTVSQMMRELGLPVIDADIAARTVVEPGHETYKEVVEHFGTGILNEDKTINREALGSIVFHDENERAVLNSIVHPAVRKYMLFEKEAYIQKGHQAVVMDIPLLFESKLEKMVDRIILVYTDDDTQLERLMERNTLSEEEAMARIGSQMPLSQKVPLADAVIDNNGTINETKTQLEHILETWGVI